jgi:hypothetical protein
LHWCSWKNFTVEFTCTTILDVFSVLERIKDEAIHFSPGLHLPHQDFSNAVSKDLRGVGPRWRYDRSFPCSQVDERGGGILRIPSMTGPWAKHCRIMRSILGRQDTDRPSPSHYPNHPSFWETFCGSGCAASKSWKFAICFDSTN